MKVSEMEVRGSKTLVAGEPKRQPSWPVWILMKGFRVVLLTVLWAGLGMGVGLFSGILGVLVVGAARHLTPDLSMAYRYVAIPVAIISGSCAFLWNLVRTFQAAAERHKALRELSR